MALAGPRLDRPSGVGEEGRPRTISLWVAAAVVVALVGVGGVLIGQPSLLPTLGTGVGLVVAGIGLVERDRFGLQVTGYVLFVLFGGLLLLELPLLVVYGQFGLAVAGLAVALFGMGLAWADVGAGDGLKHVAVGTLVAYGTMLLSLLVGAVVVSLTLVTVNAATSPTGGPSSAMSLVWVVVAAGYAAGALRVARWQLPLARLAPRDRRPAVEARLESVGRATLGVAAATPVVVFLLAVVDAFDLLSAANPAVAAALDVLAWPPLLVLFGGVGTLALVVSLAAALLRRVTREFDAVTRRRAAAGVAGVVLAVLLGLTAAFEASVPRIGAAINLLTLVLALVAVPLVLVVVGFLGFELVRTGLVPDRAGGPAIAATGLVVAAAGFGRGPGVLVFGCAAGAAVVWDVSWFGLGLTAELGHIPDTRRLELLHGVVAVGLGAGTLVVLLALDAARTGLLAGLVGTTGMFLAGLGALCLLFVLRG